MTRLTDAERRDRALSEQEFQRQVCDLATLLGWVYAHWRPAQNRRGMWQVPVEGPLGAGWVDLTLVRVRDRRLLFVELKRETGTVTVEQSAVLAALGELDNTGGPWPQTGGAPLPPWIQVAVWRPSMLRDPIETSPIYDMLR